MNSYYGRRPQKPLYSSSRRLHLMGAVALVFASIIGMRLFYLQVIVHGNYVAQAQSQHLEGVELRAKRGDILAEDYHSGKQVTFATNSTWYLLYVDPLEVREPAKVAGYLSPFVFDYFCGQKVDIRMTKELCVNTINEFLGLSKKTMVPAPEPKEETIITEEGEEVTTETPTVVADTGPQPLPIETSMEELQRRVHDEILRLISQKQTTFTQLKLTDDPEILKGIDELRLTGIYTTKSMVWANPEQIPDASAYARQLSEPLSLDVDYLERVLSPRPLRYVPIIKKLDPVVSDKIQKAKDEDYDLFYTKQIEYPVLKGVVLMPESYRYYPEGQLASQMIGFVDHSQIGRYGIEEMYDKELRGVPGKIIAESDPFGRQITIRKSIIEPPEDGDHIVLTIDRVVQEEVERRIKKTVIDTRANAAQAVVMDPHTGGIIAMASYPTFDPNNFGDVYEMQTISFDPGRGVPVFVYDENNNMREATDAERGNPYLTKYVYKNRFGPGTYQNLAISGLWEPGSIFKPIIMAAALDAGEVDPRTRYFDAGAVEVDDFTIRNATDACMGTHDMIHALNYSCNIGMIFVAEKMGQSLMYKYIEDFGFGDRTLVDLAGEVKGQVKYYREWSDARFFNTSFGQGLTATPIQMARAYTALANGGLLLKPQIVKEIIKHDGTVIETKPEIVKQVISQDAANTITAMLTSSTEWGVARRGAVANYSIAGKTGTSQTTYRGRYEKGVGNTITSFAGYGPSNNPQYVLVLKIDRPRTTEWSEATSAPLFSELSSFLLDYYNIPPNKQDAPKGF